jgi:hypothetical protein
MKLKKNKHRAEATCKADVTDAKTEKTTGQPTHHNKRKKK